MHKLNYFGTGPKIGIVTIPWLILTIIISLKNNSFTYISADKYVLPVIGIMMFIAGLIYYFITIKLLLKGMKQGVLVTKGAFSYCRNPLYANFILVLIPSLSLIVNSWLVLTSSLAGYVLFKIFIRDEYKDLEKSFGEEYNNYKKKTPEFFPVPFKNWFS